MNDIKIVCSCGNDYAPHCGALMASIFEHNKNNRIEINVLTDELNEDNISKFENLSLKYNQSVKFHILDTSDFEVFSHSNSVIKLPIRTYFRLIIPKLFPDYEKIIYLDVDMIVRADLSEIWNLDISRFAIAGVEDTARNIPYACKRLVYPIEHSYYNAGFAIYNIRKLHSLWADSVKLKQIMGDTLMYHDQDILNKLYHGQYFTLSVKWNMMQTFYMQNPSIVDSQKDNLNKYLLNPSIIHYTAPLKPWFIECKHPFKAEYWKYLAMTPWSDRKPIHVYNNTRTFFKYIKSELVLLRYKLRGDKSHILKRNLKLEIQ